jgi:hypothetical protein
MRGEQEFAPSPASSGALVDVEHRLFGHSFRWGFIDNTMLGFLVYHYGKPTPVVTGKSDNGLVEKSWLAWIIHTSANLSRRHTGRILPRKLCPQRVILQWVKFPCFSAGKIGNLQPFGMHRCEVDHVLGQDNATKFHFLGGEAVERMTEPKSGVNDKKAACRWIDVRLQKGKSSHQLDVEQGAGTDVVSAQSDFPVRSGAAQLVQADEMQRPGSRHAAGKRPGCNRQSGGLRKWSGQNSLRQRVTGHRRSWNPMRPEKFLQSLSPERDVARYQSGENKPADLHRCKVTLIWWHSEVTSIPSDGTANVHFKSQVDT